MKMILSNFILVLAIIALATTLLNILFWPRVRAAPPQTRGTVSILVPARNEESNLSACLDAALSQGENIREILIYDDHSTDATPKIVSAYASRDFRIRLLEPIPLDAGWCGKNFACFQLAKAATSDFLLFIDADARLGTNAAQAMLGELNRRNLTMLSCWPGLDAKSFWEVTLMPMLNFVVLTLFPAPLSLRFSYPSLALAHGACMMFERSQYFEIGGHSAVRDKIFEDTELARLWRSTGARSLCLDGQRVVRVRMYSSFAGVWRGFEKNFYPAFQWEGSFWLFLLFHFCVFLAPFLVLLFDFSISALIAALCILSARVALAFYFGQSVLAVFAHPIAEAILLGIGVSSWFRCKSGKGVVWKGREYFSSD